MKYEWAEGFVPPKDLTAEQVYKSILRLPEPTPERLLEASKSSKHVLHDDLWSEGDQVWAKRARLERCRHIIAAVREVVVVGGKSLTVRSVECVKGQWATLPQIASSPDLRRGYMEEVRKLLEQAQAKLAKGLAMGF